MPAARTPEEVTREIAREREQLAAAVAHLRGELKQATTAKAILKSQGPRLAAGAVVLAMAIAARKRRSRGGKPDGQGRERFSLGRFTVVERE
jgi:hypothetical protein